jgi:hypothetical protein
VTRSFLPRLLAISGVVTIAAAEPSETPQQSNRPSGSATIGAFSTVSMSISLRRWARGFLAPLAWLFTDTCEIARLSRSASMPCLAR